jgi:hypothetical protein
VIGLISDVGDAYLENQQIVKGIAQQKLVSSLL